METVRSSPGTRTCTTASSRQQAAVTAVAAVSALTIVLRRAKSNPLFFSGEMREGEEGGWQRKEGRAQTASSCF